MNKARVQASVEKEGKRLLRRAEKIPRFKNSRLAAALFDAIHYHKSDLAVWLLQHGADPRAKDGKQRSALWWAVTRCRSEVVQELVRRGVELPNDVLVGPVIGAQPDLVRFLIKRGANVNCVASQYTGIGHLNLKEHVLVAAIRTAAMEPKAESIPIMLVRAGAEVNQLVGNNTWSMMAIYYTRLGMAADHGLLNTVKAMIAAGADVNLRDKKGRTPLFNALANAHLPVVKELLRAGAKTNIRDNRGMTPAEMLQRQEDSPEMEESEWAMSEGFKVSQRKLNAQKQAWHALRTRMISLLERQAKARK